MKCSQVAKIIFEEVSFATFQHAIKKTQHFFQIEGDRKTFRVIIVGTLFGLLHLVNRHHCLVCKIVHVSSCILGGVTLSLLREKYHSIMPGIVYHTLHNQAQNYILRKAIDLVAFTIAVKKVPERACSMSEVP